MTNNNYEISYHYAVDDIQAVQGLPLNRNGWHASDGAGPGNMTTIAIEICYSLSGGARFDKAEENAAELIAQLLKERGWGIDRVKRHYDYAPNKKYCPHRTMDKGWDRFLNMVKSKMGQSPTPTPQPKPSKPKIDIYYAVKTKKYGWLSEVKNLDDYAGYKNEKIIGLIRYRATTISGVKLGWVTGCNMYDYKNGWAGTNKGDVLATIEVEYFTPKDIAQSSGYQYAKYKVNNYSYQIDLYKTNGMDGYAGKKGVACTKFQAYID